MTTRQKMRKSIKVLKATRQKGTTEWKIRIQPVMIEQLALAAEERGISINAEMVERLRKSFESGTLLSLWQIQQDMSIVWERFGSALLDRDQFLKTIRAAYFLFKALPPELQKTAAVTELMNEVVVSEAMLRRISGADK